MITCLDPKVTSVFRNVSTIGSVGFSPAVVLSSPDSGSWTVKLADLDGDGRLDIVAPADVVPVGAALAYHNQSTVGTISFAQKVSFATGAGPLDLLAGDLDLDGRPDLVTGTLYYGTGLSVLHNLTESLSPSPTHHVSVRAFDSCGDSLDLAFGLAPNATDCIDPLYGEQDLPPVPPSGAFDVRFILPCDSASLRDFRSDLLTAVIWKLRLQACAFPLTLTWDTTHMPAGHLHLRDPFGGMLVDVDMKTQTSLTLASDVPELWVHFYQHQCLIVTVRGRWNAVSLPVAPARHYLEAFPSAVMPPYRFDVGVGYVQADTLEPGTGYWMKFAEPASPSICGVPSTLRDVGVTVGWNMIGAFEDSVEAASVTSTPPGILGSPFYSYTGTYQTVIVLAPGKGY